LRAAHAAEQDELNRVLENDRAQQRDSTVARQAMADQRHADCDSAVTTGDKP
jgi:hypothetical protein